MTGDSRTLSRGYKNGTLVRVRAGVYFGKAAWLSLKPWERYRITMAAVAAVDASTTFCYLTTDLESSWARRSNPRPRHYALFAQGGRTSANHPRGAGCEDGENGH